MKILKADYEVLVCDKTDRNPKENWVMYAILNNREDAIASADKALSNHRYSRTVTTKDYAQ